MDPDEEENIDILLYMDFIDVNLNKFYFTEDSHAFIHVHTDDTILLVPDRSREGLHGTRGLRTSTPVTLEGLLLLTTISLKDIVICNNYNRLNLKNVMKRRIMTT